MRLTRNVLLLGCLLVLGAGAVAGADDFILADGKAWPGKLLVQRGPRAETLLTRGGHLPQDAVPRVQSVTTLPSGRVVFCSGLDRWLFEATSAGERQLHHGGYLARQVRTNSDGKLYWSGLETPRDNDPLPDGFIYSWDEATGNVRTELTFSQGDVGRDWWGAFDVREGRVYVGTLRDRTRIYDVSVSPVRELCTLPIAATAFRFAADGGLYACDGHGKLYRFVDLTDTQRFEVVLQSAVPFVDFDFHRPAR